MLCSYFDQILIYESPSPYQFFVHPLIMVTNMHVDKATSIGY